MSEISALEQEMLEFINRARMDPGGEFDLIVADADTVTGTSADITNAMRFFGVDPDAFHDAMDSYSSFAPLAWNSNLADAASGHSSALLAADAQTHQLPNGPDISARVNAAGYTGWSTVRENIYAYTNEPFQAHAGFMLDWGYDAEDFNNGTLRANWKNLGDGMQDPAGHRDSIMSNSVTEVGIGIIEDPDQTNSVGPLIVTQNFGNRFAFEPQVVGVVIDDTDGDNFYDVGEGMGGVSVAFRQNDTLIGTTTTWDAGGYQIALAAGTYDVTFSGGALTGEIETTVTLGAQNIKLDALAEDAVVAGPTQGNDVLTGTPSAELISALAGGDWIIPSGGNDTVDGGQGRDMISFSNLPDTAGRTNADYRLDIDLTAGRAISYDSAEVITITNVERVTGTIFADKIKGDEHANELRGLGDYDWFIATEGGDTLNGGNGLDMVSFQGYTSTTANSVSNIFSANGAPPSGAQASGVVVDLSDASRNTGLAEGQTLISIERITGSSHQDVFYGDDGQNDFRGLGDYDWFVSSAGGRERYFGGDGLDTVTYFNAGARVAANLSNGATVDGLETGYGSAGDAARDLYFEIENLVGSHFNDDLRGSSGGNQLSGLSGDDFLFGGGGVDYLKGGAGNDTIDGGAGSDFALFNGNAADYTLTRSNSDVTVTGADGTDTLINVEYFSFDDTNIDIWSLAIV